MTMANPTPPIEELRAKELLAEILAVPVQDAYFVAAGIFDFDRAGSILAKRLAETALAAQSASDEGVREAAAQLLDDAIGEGYPTPVNKVDQCVHGKFGWEDCIACYDDKLTEVVAAIRKIDPQSLKGEG